MKTIPVLQNQYQEAIRESIRKDATFNWAYLLMNVLAATIASYGLFANSPAVVIGAMIVAMLLGPIAGISLALVDSDMKFLLKSLSTLLGGTIGVIVTAFIVGTIHKDIPITNEIMARTAPNLLDLMIALAGGAAGAYATVSPRLSVVFVGVAIATALVPPLSSAGILFARGEVDLVLGALLLAFTNMVAIQFAFSVVLWFTGFRRVTHTSGIIPINIFQSGILLAFLFCWCWRLYCQLAFIALSPSNSMKQQPIHPATGDQFLCWEVTWWRFDLRQSQGQPLLEL